MTVENVAFIDIEESLSKGMQRAWMREQGTQVTREIRRAIEQDDFDEAYRLVDTFDFNPVVQRRMSQIESQATAAYILGQSFWTGGDLESTLLGGGDEDFPVEIDQAAQALAFDWQFNGTAAARQATRKLIADAQSQAEQQGQGSSISNAGMIQKAIIPGLDTALNKAVAGNVQVAFAQGANVTTVPSGEPWGPSSRPSRTGPPSFSGRRSWTSGPARCAGLSMGRSSPSPPRWRAS